MRGNRLAGRRTSRRSDPGPDTDQANCDDAVVREQATICKAFRAFGHFERFDANVTSAGEWRPPLTRFWFADDGHRVTVQKSQGDAAQFPVSEMSADDQYAPPSSQQIREAALSNCAIIGPSSPIHDRLRMKSIVSRA